MKTKIEIELDLLLEALSGLRAFGKTATDETVQKIQSVVIDSELTNKKVFRK